MQGSWINSHPATDFLLCFLLYLVPSITPWVAGGSPARGFEHRLRWGQRLFNWEECSRAVWTMDSGLDSSMVKAADYWYRGSSLISSPAANFLILSYYMYSISEHSLKQIHSILPIIKWVFLQANLIITLVVKWVFTQVNSFAKEVFIQANPFSSFSLLSVYLLLWIYSTLFQYQVSIM
jgi:hypothetical protein